jgi:hypothetical protein
MSTPTQGLRQEMPWMKEEGPDPILAPEIEFAPKDMSEKLTWEIYQESLNQLKNNKAEGPGEVPNEIIKAIPIAYHKQVFRMFGHMWRTGNTPKHWKHSYVKLLYKQKGDKALLANWRPICLSMTIMKLWTSCITKVLSDFAEEHGILHNSQEGFRRTRSTRRQIARLINVIEDSHITGTQLHALYIDFTNAFGSTDHTKLQDVMRHLGFPEDAIKVVAGLYPGNNPNASKMKTQIITKHGLTEAIEILRGNIQGDNLSPLLFLIYIEPLLRWLGHGNRGYVHGTSPPNKKVTTETAAYADDLCIAANTIRNMKIQAEKVQKFSEWSDLWVNTKVGKSAITNNNGPTGKHAYDHIQFRDHEGTHTKLNVLHKDEPYKYLGIHITMSLVWKAHKQYVTNTLAKKINQLLRCPANINQGLSILNMAVGPMVEYSIPFGIFNQAEVQILTNMISRCAKHICKQPTSTRNVYSTLPKECYGLGVPHLMDSYSAAAGDMLRDHLNEKSPLGDGTRALVKHYIKIRGGSITNNINNKMSNKSCVISQLQSLHEEGIVIYGKYGDHFKINTDDITQDPRVRDIRENSGRDKQLVRPMNLNIFTPLWEDLGIYAIDKLMNEEGTHLISVDELKKDFRTTKGKIKGRHVRALKQLYIQLCVGGRRAPKKQKEGKPVLTEWEKRPANEGEILSPPLTINDLPHTHWTHEKRELLQSYSGKRYSTKVRSPQTRIDFTCHTNKTIYDVEKIVDFRINDEFVEEYKVRWDGYGNCEDTWETSDNFPQDMISQYHSDGEDDPDYTPTKRNNTRNSRPQREVKRYKKAKPLPYKTSEHNEVDPRIPKEILAGPDTTNSGQIQYLIQWYPTTNKEEAQNFKKISTNNYHTMNNGEIKWNHTWEPSHNIPDDVITIYNNRIPQRPPLEYMKQSKSSLKKRDGPREGTKNTCTSPQKKQIQTKMSHHPTTPKNHSYLYKKQFVRYTMNKGKPWWKQYPTQSKC